MEQRKGLPEVLTALHDAALDDALWPFALALIDEVCEITGSAFVVSDKPAHEVRILFAGTYRRGQRRQDLERGYFDTYFLIDERVPRIKHLPEGKLARLSELYTEEERKKSPVYNEWFSHAGSLNGLNVRLAGPGGTHITWVIADPTRPGGWGSEQVETIERLLPHIRQFVRTRQAVAGARALGASLGGLLETTRIGMIYLDGCGRIVEANTRALDLMRRRDGLADHDGFLGAWLPADDARLKGLLAQALPTLAGPTQAAGSLTVSRASAQPPLVVHLNPLTPGYKDLGFQKCAVLVLVVDVSSRPRHDARLVKASLGLSAAESQVAVMLSEGKTPRDIAEATGRREGTVKVLIRRAYRKLGISRQTDLMRLVLSLPEGFPRR